MGTSDSKQQTVEVEQNSGTITQETVERKIENKGVDKVIVNEIDPLLFGTLVFAFIVWSYFLYRLPSPDQIWHKK